MFSTTSQLYAPEIVNFLMKLTVREVVEERRALNVIFWLEREGLTPVAQANAVVVSAASRRADEG